MIPHALSIRGNNKGGKAGSLSLGMLTTRRRVPAALAAGILLALPLSGAAKPGTGDTTFLLVLLDIPSAETRDEIDDAVRSQTSDLDLRIGFLDYSEEASGGFSIAEARALAADHEADFVFLISQGQGAALKLHVFDSARGSMLVEEMGAQEGSPVVQAETVAIRVRSCLLLLAEGAHVGLEPSSSQEAAPVSGAGSKPPQTAGNVLEVILGYSLATLAPEQKAVHGLTVGLGIAPALLRGTYFEVAYTLSPEFSAHDDLVYLRVAHHPVLLGIRYTLGRGRLRVLPGLAVLLEHVARETVASDHEVSVTGGADGLHVALVPSARFSVNLFGHFDLFGQVGMDIYVRRAGYGYRSGGEDVELISPWYVRFDLLVGLAANLF